MEYGVPKGAVCACRALARKLVHADGFQNGRGIAEQRIKEGKNAVGALREEHMGARR